MNDQLKLVIELQQIDSKILAARRMIDSFPKKISEAELPFKQSLNAFNTFKQKLETLEKKKREKERQLDDVSEKIKKLKLRTSEIKTNKEYQALLGEIETFEKEHWTVEEQILVIMEESEAVSKQSGSEEAKFKADGKRLEELKKKLEDEKAVAEKELESVKESRSKIAALVEEDTYKLYITMLETHNGSAVAEARDEICQGCNMNIPPQLFVELKKNNDIVTCPQCRRILYFVNTA